VHLVIGGYIRVNINFSKHLEDFVFRYTFTKLHDRCFSVMLSLGLGLDLAFFGLGLGFEPCGLVASLVLKNCSEKLCLRCCGKELSVCLELCVRPRKQQQQPPVPVDRSGYQSGTPVTGAAAGVTRRGEKRRGAVVESSESEDGGDDDTEEDEEDSEVERERMVICHVSCS